jgi:LmbE family N-acetylglucosaminyl deacetylase
MRILIVAAHADDETFGCGGTIRRYVEEGNDVYVSILSDASAKYNDQRMIDERKKMADVAGRILGVKKIFAHDFKNLCLDQVGQLSITHVVEEDVAEVNPDMIFTHAEFDINRDHEIAYGSALVAARNIPRILTYEIPVSTTSEFRPNFLVDITRTYEKKIDACKAYYSEIDKWLPRVEKMATYRGMQASVDKAEAFSIVRWIE